MMTKMREEIPTIKIGDEQIRLLERLSNACAVSGDEGEVRRIIREEVQPIADEVKVDALGNVLATRHGQGENLLRVMLSAHMDEVGLMIISDEGEGLYRFEKVGDIEIADLPAKAVWVGKEHIPGVIGVKPVHLTEPEERKKPMEIDSLRIDTGPATGKVRPGDRATFATTFIRQGTSLRGKALDNRLGVATLINLIRYAPHQVEFIAAFTVQEELGYRGARAAAYAIKPDLAINLDSTPAHDLPAWDMDENLRYNSRLGAGPAIYVADAGTLSDPRLVRYLMQTAENHQIPYQIRQPGGGGTDAAMIHRSLAGIPSVSVSVPHRYPHSPASIARLSDWQSTLSLLISALFGLSAEILAAER